MRTPLTRRHFTQMVGLGLTIAPLVTSAQSPHQNQNKEFQRWQQQQQADFSDFNDFYRQAFKDYQAGIEINWGKSALMRSKTVWVDYSDAIQRTVDFEQGFAEVSIIQDSEHNFAEATSKAKAAITALFNTTKQRLLLHDPLENSLRQQLNRSSIPVQQATAASATPVFASVAPKPRIIQTATSRTQTLSNGKKVTTVRVPLPNNNTAKRKPLLAQITKQSQQYHLDDSLISAVIQAESAFNPMATSGIPAYGLMQIVPSSAGIDVSEYLYKQKKLLSPDWLYNPDNNILAGATYLHIVSSRYLRGISNPQSRMYCTIASYNTGAGNMAKAFGSGKLHSAVKKINTLSPERVYHRLEKHLPYKETQHYLQKVTQYKQNWEQV